MPKVTRNVFVSTNNHTEITPVTRSEKAVSRSAVTINRSEKQTKSDTQRNTVTRQPVTRQPQSRTTTIVTQREQKTNPVRENMVKKTPEVRKPESRTTTTVTRQTEERAPVQTKTVTRSDVFSGHSPDGRQREKTKEKRVIHRPDSERSIARDTDRRKSGTNININKNINISRDPIASNIGHSRRPVIRKSGYSSADYRDPGLNRRGRHDIKITKHVDFHSERHGRYPGRIFSRITWPSYTYKIYYNWGPNWVFRYYRPYYHRKYVFVSIGGYWPSYSYVRYYWYGWHPYTWYGCYPTAYQVSSPTYNYYTYNNYYYDNVSAVSTAGNYWNTLPAVDQTTFEDVRQRLAEQAAQQPQAETLVDKFFADGVEAFENEDYTKAASAFADAISLDPNDVVLPFAYVQALFAAEQYSKATDILRLALAAMPADEQGLFFPRGLYKDEDILLSQTEQLKTRTETFAYDLDMSLLLGYQYIGVENYQEARHWLNHAAQYKYNKEATTILLKLLDLLEEQQAEASV